MSKQTDSEFLKNEAYESADDLKIRIDIQTRFSSSSVTWYPWLLDQLALQQAGMLLDLGSGPGNLWIDPTRLLPERLSILLSDLSHGMLSVARRNLDARSESFSFTVLDAQSLPFLGSTFDSVVGGGLLDHLSNREQGLSEIRRVMKTGGRFYTTCGSRTHLQEIQGLVEPFLGEVDYGGDPDRFGLENGAQILSTWFSEVELTRYTDNLVFSQVEPVLMYLFSEAEIRSRLDMPSRRALAESVEKQIARDGKIQVHVEKGLFQAQKG